MHPMSPALPLTERVALAWFGVCRALGPRMYRAAKRSLDVMLAGTALLLLSPLLAAIAVAIRAGDGGPVLFVQPRIGLHGRPFDFPKFRSMGEASEGQLQSLRDLNHHGDSITFKSKADPRITPVGRFIRKFSLDELPQLWSVLKGDMTLVGPRPALPSEVARSSFTARRRLAVEPGITCLWQVSGRGDLAFDEQLELDLRYIRERSLATDLRLLALTLPAVLSARGAY